MKNTQVHVTFGPEVITALKKLAKKEQTSMAGITRKLVIEALAEQREDEALVAIAKRRLSEKTETVAYEDVIWK